MNIERALTEFSQSRYNNRMEANVGLLERKEAVREEFEPNTPKGSELQQELERRMENLGPANGRPEVPEFVLRKEDNWEKFGWTKKDKDEILAQIKSVLKLDDDYAKNALENIVASNTSPEKAKELITQDTFSEYLGHFKKPEPEEELAAQQRGETASQELSEEEAAKRAKFALFRGMGIKEDYIKRFILAKEFRQENKRDYDGELPADLYELAWNLTVFDHENFGVNGKFPVLQLQVGYKKDKQGNFEKDADGKPIWEGRYVVNEANFMRWIRKEINVWYDIDTDEVSNYFEKIVVTKAQYTSVSLGTMLYNHERYFKDENGQKYDDLYQQALVEPLMMMYMRGYDIEYKSVMGDETKLAETITKSFYLNKMTRKAFQKSFLYYQTTLGVDFDGKNSDSKMGEAWNKIYLAYYNLGDFEKLQEVLGKESNFFTKKGMIDAITKVYEKKYKATGLPLMGKVLGEKEADFKAAFDEQGNISTEKNREAFIRFINFFVKPSNDEDLIDVVREALRNSVSDLLVSKEGNVEKFDEKHVTADDRVADEHTVGVAELTAYSWLRISGAAAKNDVNAAGFDAQSKWMRTEAYRRKMATNERGGGFGNPYTVPMFKQVLVDVFRGTNVVNAYTYDKNGAKIRNLTPLEVMTNMQAITGKYEKERERIKGALEKATTEEAKKEAKQQLSDLDELEKVDYKLMAGKLEFDDNALKQYALDHVNRARTIYDQIMTAHEIDFDKFTVYDSAMRGVSFKRAEFQAAVQKEFLTHLRYLLASYDKLNFNMDVRSQVFVKRDEKGKDVWKYETMPLGQAIFGHQILDIHEFRKTGKLTEEDRAKGYRKSGRYLKDKDGKYVIDYDKVQDNKTLAWKQWALMKLGADMWTHIDRHSRDPAYGLAHYIDIIEALESIPGEVFGDETNMRGGRVIKPFFSHAQIKWMRKMSGTTDLKLFTKAILTDIFQSKHRKEGLFSESANTFIGAIFKGF
ncbi:MAG: hypothetical protein ACREHC_08505 [Candidatus Levyibacteriota bacterium]